MSRLLWEAIHRSSTGQIMPEEKFETEYFPTVLEEIRARHQIECDPEEPVMIDPDVADAVFELNLVDQAVQIRVFTPTSRGQQGIKGIDR